MSIINLLSNDVWSEADIQAHGRAVIAAQVSEARQNELRTIMLGHIAGMRIASAEELAEIGLVQALTEEVVFVNQEARKDNALLTEVLEYTVDTSKVVSSEVLELYALRNPVIAEVLE